MAESTPHHRWRLDVPEDQEEALVDWLMRLGVSATYRKADPPRTFFAYFPPGCPGDPVGLAGFPGVSLTAIESFEDEDWLAKSREGFGHFPVGGRFFIRPAWDPTPAPDGRIPIVVNPGLAFGTGGHETTRLCMTLLEDLAASGRLAGPILDVGTGTGILALCAHLLGFKEILAFDLDPDCGPALEELVAMNGAILKDAKPFDGFIGDLDHPRVTASAPYQGLIANILLETIADLLPGLFGIAAPGAWLVASGLLAEREDEALLVLTTGGFRPKRLLREGQWIAVLCERTP
jgi:ribosomal protein L11 methyltransferase